MSFALLMLACSDEPVPTPTTDADADTDTDSDTDSDADTDSDTDSDADTDTTGTTGETGIQCVGVVQELDVFAEARDSTGLACTVCTAGQISLYAGIRNPCPIDIDVEIGLDCMVNSYTLIWPSGDGEGVASDCGYSVGTVTVPAGGFIEEMYTQRNLQQPGTYDTEAVLTTRPNSQTVVTSFQIP